MLHEKHAKAGLHRHTFLCCLVATLLFCNLFGTGNAKALYILTGAEDSAIVLDETADTANFSSKLLFIGTRAGGDPELTLAAGQTVSLVYEGATLSITSRDETISALLSRNHVVPAPLDMIAVDVSDEIVKITVDSNLTFYDIETVTDPMQIVRVPNANLAKGTENILQAGADGTKTRTYEVIYTDGKLTSRQLVEESAGNSTAQTVEYGTKVASISREDRISEVFPDGDGGGVLRFKSGDSLNYKAVKKMTATAYTAGYGGVGTKTATGTRVHVGSVAVDPKVIPLGSKLYIVANGS
ncbi:MAG: G5 domain-containing protein, partial [Pygmaiobacter sp.]